MVLTAVAGACEAAAPIVPVLHGRVGSAGAERCMNRREGERAVQGTAGRASTARTRIALGASVAGSFETAEAGRRGD